MTREEAIAIIENEKECVNRANKNDYCNRDCYNCELVKTDTEILNALDMAIKALEQEPCEDCISRQAVIDGIKNYFYDEYYQRTSIQDCRDCLIEDVIKDMPPVTPQQKMGHWIIQWNIAHQKEYYYCSECREEFSYDGETGIKMNNYDFCPNCGAKMVEPQESEG